MPDCECCATQHRIRLVNRSFDDRPRQLHCLYPRCPCLTSFPIASPLPPSDILVSCPTHVANRLFSCRRRASAPYGIICFAMLITSSYCANVGQQGEDYEAITKKAKDCGASKVRHGHSKIRFGRTCTDFAGLPDAFATEV